MRHSVVRVLTTVVTAAVVAVGGATAASATTCPSGSACIWANPSYKSTATGGTYSYVKFSRYIPNYGLHRYEGLPAYANDNASSVYNNGNHDTAYFYSGYSGAGTRVTLAKKKGDANLGNNEGAIPTAFDDQISSGKFASYSF